MNKTVWGRAGGEVAAYLSNKLKSRIVDFGASDMSYEFWYILEPNFLNLDN